MSLLKEKHIQGLEWQERALLKDIPTYDFDKFLRKLSKFDVSYVDEGYYSLVFRLRSNSEEKGITLKLFRFGTLTTVSDIAKLFKASNREIETRKIEYYYLQNFRYSHEIDDLVARQAAGHVLGSLIAPKNIDPPICLWARDGMLLGYSLPFIEGIPARIRDHIKATELANKIETNNIYLGNRGIGSSSKNVIICTRKQPKFIDVRIKDPNNYSLPFEIA